MALNYKSGTDIQAAITASQNSDALDVRGYSKLAIQVKFGTCTGVIDSAAKYTLQTSNVGGTSSSDWSTIVGEIQTSTSGAALNGVTVYKHFPDNATADETGFGRFIRFRMVVTGAPSLSYTTYWYAIE